MRRLIRIRTMALMEVLGSVSLRSPDPRRNTSKEFFESFRKGKKRQHVSALFPVVGIVSSRAETELIYPM